MKEQLVDIEEWKKANGNGAGNEVKEKNQEIESLQAQVMVMKKAQIILYAILGYNDKSVKIALGCGDVLSAKKYANRPEEQKERKSP